uniref:Uncharacterized protein n=1 Tax=Cannabis sativa TaxID=3483 RepID=A0A803QRF8_CANSA
MEASQALLIVEKHDFGVADAVNNGQPIYLNLGRVHHPLHHDTDHQRLKKTCLGLENFWLENIEGKLEKPHSWVILLVPTGGVMLMVERHVGLAFETLPLGPISLFHPGLKRV